MKKPKIFLFLTQVANCGVGYYRQWLPLKRLEEQGKIELRVIDFNWGKKEIPNPYIAEIGEDQMHDIKLDKKFEEAMHWADLIYICRDESTPFISVIGGFKEYFKREKIKKPILVDIDDMVAHTRPHNPGYMSFYPGSSYIPLNKHLATLVDGITVSTEYLKKFYKNDNKNISVCPNSLDLRWRDKYADVKPAFKKKKDEIRIGWAGSAAHWENLKQIEKPLYEIMKKYPNVTFHYTGLYGDLFKWRKMKDRIKTVGFVDLKEWPKKLKSMGFDIALAPLADNNFNRAKSNLRVLEYWAAGYPVIASPVEPYKFIREGVDGYLAMEENEWFDRLELLVKDKYVRNALANKGYLRVKEEFNVDMNADVWMSVFKKFIS